MLKVKANVSCNGIADVYIKYWEKGKRSEIYETPVSRNKENHAVVLTNLKAASEYEYQVVTVQHKKETATSPYNFTTGNLPVWLKDAFAVLNPNPQNIPAAFKKGYVMLYKREEPGTIYFVDEQGKIRWYHRVENTGVKVAHYTRRQTILAILGDATYETSYGNQVMELSLSGDTLLHLKKGDTDFTQTIHHEIILTPENNIATLTVEKRATDLSSIGGSKQDTVQTDGIVVFDRKGKKIWAWNVMDTEDPLKAKNILKEKKDWMHANSLAYAPDGNFLISFYNTGQIWKVDSKTGKLLWKFGRGGDFTVPGMFPEQCHAVHYNSAGDLMFFDNGTVEKKSRILSFSLNEETKHAAPKINITLPKNAYNERMGSSYLAGDSAILTCASKRNLIILSRFDNTYLWVMNTSGISPYRAEFIPADMAKPYLIRN